MKAAAATAAALGHLRNVSSPLLTVRDRRPDARRAAALSQSGTNVPATTLNGRECPAAGVRFRPSPATCDASIPRSGDRRPMDARGPRQSRPQAPGDVFPVPQGGLGWTCWGVLLMSVDLTVIMYTLWRLFRSGFSLCIAAIPALLWFSSTST